MPERVIVVHFVPKLEQPPKVFKSSTEKVGYATPDGDETYRVWVGNQTSVFPAANILEIETYL